MSMSTSVVGFQSADDKWVQYKAVWDACIAAKVDVPKIVSTFFGGEYPRGNGREVNLEKLSCCKEYNGDMISGYEIEVSKLPAEIQVIRFYNSW